MVGNRYCRLEESIGRIEICPAERCPFWERGATAVAGHCAFDGVDLRNNPQIAGLLLVTRNILEAERPE
jgi:hypothetical protein